MYNVQNSNENRQIHAKCLSFFNFKISRIYGRQLPFFLISRIRASLWKNMPLFIRENGYDHRCMLSVGSGWGGIRGNEISRICPTICDGALPYRFIEKVRLLKQKCWIKHNDICCRDWTFLLLKTLTFRLFCIRNAISNNCWKECYCWFTKRRKIKTSWNCWR